MTPLETSVAAAHREPDLAEELDRAEVDEETPSPSQQRQLLRAHVTLGHPAIGEFCRALRNGRCRPGVVRWVKRYFKCPECEARTDAVNSAGSNFAEMLSFQSSLWHRHDGSSESVASRKSVCIPKTQSKYCTSSVMGTRYHQGARRQDMTATERFSTLRQFWLKHYDAIKVLIMDQGTEFGADFQHLSQSRGILPVVTDLETCG